MIGQCKHQRTAEFCSLCEVQFGDRPVPVHRFAPEAQSTIPSGMTAQQVEEVPVSWLCQTVVTDEEIEAISAGLSFISHLESKLKHHQIGRVWKYLNARFESSPAGLMGDS